MSLRILSLCLVAAIFLSASLSCGTSAGVQLQSISIAPIAPAVSASGGSIHFIATGFYSDGTQVSPFPVRWSMGNPWSPPPLPCCASLSDSGVAQCNGAGGQFPIYATAPADPALPLDKMTMSTKNVSNNTTFTCQ